MQLKKTGVVFSGGGAKGIYELGAWKALKELGIEISGVAGASIGALNGALLAQGDFELAEQLWETVNIQRIVSLPEVHSDNLLDLKNAQVVAWEWLKTKGGLSTQPLRELLNTYIDVGKIMASPVDFALVTFSLSTLDPIEIYKKDIPADLFVDYLLASSRLPVFQPIVIDNKRLFDGGAYDNMPVSLLVDRGYEQIIAIDLASPGLVRTPKQHSASMLHIRASGLGGLLDFSQETLTRDKNLGYFDTLRALEHAEGAYFYFHPGECQKLCDAAGLQEAGRIFELPRFKLYTADEFTRAVAERHAEAKARYEALSTALNFTALAQSVRNHALEFSRLLPFILEACVAGTLALDNSRMAKALLPGELAAANALKTLDSLA